MLATNRITLTHLTHSVSLAASSKNAVIPLEDFEGGHLWVQSPEQEWSHADLSQGERGDILKWPTIFDPGRLHATTPRTKGHRSVAIADRRHA